MMVNLMQLHALAQAAAVAVLPVPDALEPLLQKFSVVTAVYGFLLRQHIQVCVMPITSLALLVSVAGMTHMAWVSFEVIFCECGLQPSWRAVAAALPSMPGGADIVLADIELMARLAPDVLILRQDLGWGSGFRI